MATIGVVTQLDGVVRDATDGVPERLGLGRVVLRRVAHGALAVARDDRADEVVGRDAGAREDGLGDRLAVDRHRDRLADLRLAVRDRVGRDRETDEADAGLRLVDVTVTEFLGDGRHRRDRELVGDLDVVGPEVVVRCFQLVVNLERDGIQLGLSVRLREVLVALDLDLLVVLPLPVHLERAVADGGLFEGLLVLEEGLRQRVERVVAQHGLELGERGAQRDGEGLVVDDRQALELVGGRLLVLARGQLLGALDLGEERQALGRVVLVGAPVPRVDEGLRGDLLTVVEGVAVLQLDRPDLAVGRLDRLGDAEPGSFVLGRTRPGRRRPAPAPGHPRTPRCSAGSDRAAAHPTRC